MFIGQGHSLEDCHAAQAQKGAANTATVAASVLVAAAKRALSASPPLFAPPTKMESIASVPPSSSAT